MSQRSKCCLAAVKVVDAEPFFEGDAQGVTMHYECTNCGNACDIDSPPPSNLPDELKSYDSIKMFRALNQIISYLKSRE